MNIYQPALNAYQHGQDRSLENMFKLATAPTPAATFMQNLMQREKTERDEYTQDRDYGLREIESQRRMKHEDNWYNNEEQKRKKDLLEVDRKTADDKADESLGLQRLNAAIAKAKDAKTSAESRSVIQQAQFQENIALRRAQNALQAGRDKEAQKQHDIANGFAQIRINQTQQGINLRIKASEASNVAKGIPPGQVAALWGSGYKMAKDDMMEDEAAENFADNYVKKSLGASSTYAPPPVAPAPGGSAGGNKGNPPSKPGGFVGDTAKSVKSGATWTWNGSNWE